MDLSQTNVEEMGKVGFQFECPNTWNNVNFSSSVFMFLLGIFVEK